MSDHEDLPPPAVIEPRRDPKWIAVGSALAERMLLFYDLQAQLSKASGVSPTSLSRILRGQPIVRLDKKRALARALHWPDDAIQRLFDGESADDIETVGTPPDSEANERP